MQNMVFVHLRLRYSCCFQPAHQIRAQVDLCLHPQNNIVGARASTYIRELLSCSVLFSGKSPSLEAAVRVINEYLISINQQKIATSDISRVERCSGLFIRSFKF